jgi:hypothetical protein
VPTFTGTLQKKIPPFVVTGRDKEPLCLIGAGLGLVAVVLGAFEVVDAGGADGLAAVLKQGGEDGACAAEAARAEAEIGQGLAGHRLGIVEHLHEGAGDVGEGAVEEHAAVAIPGVFIPGGGRQTLNGVGNYTAVLDDSLSFIIRKTLLKILRKNLIEEFKDRHEYTPYWKALGL